MTGKASLQSDVFSFGALSLAIACGKHPVDRSLSIHNSRVVEWVWYFHEQGKILDAADERLGRNFNPEDMERLMGVGLLCSHPDPKARPTMTEVAQILKFQAPLPYIPSNLPLAVYSFGNQSVNMSTSTSTSYGMSMAMNSSREAGHEAGNDCDMELDELFAQGPRRFSYAELGAATGNFTDNEKLGQGGFGGVYKGILPGTDKAVAVKRISHGSKQGRKEYMSEVTIFMKVRHRNLVQLLGWCHERGEFLLVYEFLPNGSLDKYLFGEQNGGLEWEPRYSIACNVASALVYLHEDCSQQVVHRDVKASNVMLDSNFTAKLGDFGLARVLERNNEATHRTHTTQVAGTFGYMAPEFVMTGKASPESDVFSFGAVSLEIACGKRPVDRSLTEHNSRLVEWVWDLYGQGKIVDAADERLRANFYPAEMERLMAVGLLCSHPDPKARPTMREVVKLLKFEAQLPYVPPNFPVAEYINPNQFNMSTSTSTSYGCLWR